MAKKERYIAVQEGCDNFIRDTEGEKIFGTLKQAEEVVTDAIDNEYNGFDEEEGNVVIYKITPSKVAKVTKVQFVNA